MAAALVVTALRLVLHHLDFFPESCLNNGALDLGSLNGWSPDGRVRAVVDEEHLAEDNRVTDLPARFTLSFVEGEFLDRNSVALGDDILLSTGLDDGHFHVPKL